MGVAAARKTAELARAKDPKAALLEAVGDLSDERVLYNQILVAVYVRPEITSGGILRPGSNVQEDEYQGKVGLVVKLGPHAFQSEDEDFGDADIAVGDWVVFRVGDGWSLTVRDTACRMITDRNIRIKTINPEIYY